jgi:two-component system response regulator (stage 0 sporulation protein A)
MPTALVVDDSKLICMMLTFILKEQGYAVQTVEHGGYALDILRRSTESLVVMLNLAMPVMDGEAVLEAVAEDETLAARHVFVMVTAGEERAGSGRVAALRDYLGVPLVPKPFKPQHIITAIDEAMQRRRDRQDLNTSREYPLCAEE